MNTQKKSEFIKHVPCEHCGSSDAGAIYTDGHFHCFKCGVTEQENTMEERRILQEDYGRGKQVTMLLTGEIKPISERGISRATCETYNVMQGNDKHIYPYFDRSGKYVAQKVRDVST